MTYFPTADNPSSEAWGNVWDWNQRRLVKIKGTVKPLPLDENVEIKFWHSSLITCRPKSAQSPLTTMDFLLVSRQTHKRMILCPSHIILYQPLNPLPIVEQSSIPNFKRSIDLDQVLISYRTKMNPEFVRRSHSNTTF